LLLAYLARPLNAFRHEPLVKRLFKLAEKAADDVVLARFLVALDRSVRRVRKQHTRYDWASRDTWTEETIRVPRGTAMPRDRNRMTFRNPRTGERMAAPTADRQDQMRLFSLHTRQYLRRRAWRYFRRLGQQQPQRYLPAAIEALKQYTDEDVADGLALLDNWGLVHLLFHHSPALVAQANGWKLAEGHTLAELAAAPRYESLWQASSGPLLELLGDARCRPVLQWTIQMLRRHHPLAVARLPIEQLLRLLAHEDVEVAQLATEALRQSPALDTLSVERWLELLDSANPQMLDLLCELLVQRLDASKVDMVQTVKLACSRPLPVARLGLTWLQQKRPATEEDCRLVLSLGEAEAEPVRTEAVRWARMTLGASPHFQPAWILELLDSRHQDVRGEAWEWFLAEPRAHQDVTLWQRLLESPYDDLRILILGLLEENAAPRPQAAVDGSRLEPDLVRFLWASVLLNIHRGGRDKPRVVGQMVSRLERHPGEAAVLLPILAVALRSIRGPEWRAGLAGMVRLVEHRPELEPAVRAAFPELTIE
jgi:hypothetical protein